LFALSLPRRRRSIRNPSSPTPWIGYEINVYPRGIEIWDSAQGDFDRDGHLDLAAVSWSPNPEFHAAQVFAEREDLRGVESHEF
jgi:hypothetical protein